MLLLTDRRCYVATDKQKVLCCYWQAEDAMLLLTNRRCYVATDRQKILCCYLLTGRKFYVITTRRYFATDKQKMLCCYWQAEDMLLLTRSRCYVGTDKQKTLCKYWHAEDTMLLLTGSRYVATDRQKMLCCNWQAEDAMLLLTTNIKFPVLQPPWRPKGIICICFFYIGDSTVSVMSSGMTAVWVVVTTVSSYCNCVQAQREVVGSGPACQQWNDRHVVVVVAGSKLHIFHWPLC
jgi:hypothetical protein